MKRQISPVVTAIALILVLAAVLGLYTKGLLGRKRGPADGGGGGGGGGGPVPPTGLPTVHVTTFAGYTRPGFGEGQGWYAQFNGPSGIAAAPDGSLYVSDSRNHRIRRITADGTVTTVAGGGPVDCLPGAFADGPALEARLFNPAGLTVAPDGTVYFADAGNHRIRRLRDGAVETVAGAATEVDELGFEVGGHGDGPVDQALFNVPADVGLLPSGELLVPELGNGALRRVAPGGKTGTEAGSYGLEEPTGVFVEGGQPPSAIIADPGAGRLYRWTQGAPLAEIPVHGLAPRQPTAVCAIPGGLAVADAECHVLFGIDPTGKSVLLAGILPPEPLGSHADGNGVEARFAGPCALAYSGGTLYVADFGNNCIRAVQLPADWAGPLPPPEERRPPFDRRRGRDGDRPAYRGARPDENLRGRRPGP